MENEEKTIQPKAIQIFAKAPGELGVNVVQIYHFRSFEIIKRRWNRKLQI